MVVLSGSLDGSLSEQVQLWDFFPKGKPSDIRLYTEPLKCHIHALKRFSLAKRLPLYGVFQ